MYQYGTTGAKTGNRADYSNGSGGTLVAICEHRRSEEQRGEVGYREASGLTASLGCIGQLVHIKKKKASQARSSKSLVSQLNPREYCVISEHSRKE